MEPDKCIFAILQDNKDGAYNFRGTGFFVTNEGNFLSAAHVFILGDFEKDKFVVAFPSSSAVFYDIIKLETEYTDKLNQCGPVYKDLAYGQIDLSTNDILKLEEKRPSVGNMQTVNGFVNTKVMTNKNVFRKMQSGEVDVSDIQLNQPLDTTVINKGAVVSIDMRDYEKPEDKVDNLKKYNNCFTLKHAAHSGMSGGPVLNEDGSVSGIFFGGPKTHELCHCVASKYVNKRIRVWK